MKNKNPLLISIGIALIGHIIFLIAAVNVKMPGTNTVIVRAKQFFNIRDLEKIIPQKKLFKDRGITYANRLKFKSPVYSDSAASGIEEEESDLKKPELDTAKKRLIEPSSLPTQDLLEEESSLQNIENKRIRETRKSLLKTSDIASDDILAKPDENLTDLGIPQNFMGKMPGFTPKVTGGFLDTARRKVASRLSKSYEPAIKRSTDLSDLKQYLICEVSKYKDPADNQKYYKISIRSGKDATKLPTTPKEIVFLIDCSLSIQQKRLKEFKKGLSYCLNNLNPKDRFNVMAFKEDMRWLSERSMEPTSTNIDKALRFVSKLTAGEGTDAYNALYDSINTKTTLNPSYIVLFSDGRPTYGLTNSMKIISQISNTNRGRRPIFAFSGGSRVNRYFLDFISYKNRGWTEYAHSTRAIGKQITRMYEKIKDPLLLNLRYHISGLDKTQIFPKELPDFYKNTEFTLYGKYADEDQFSLQFLGDLEGETNEFMIIGSLDKAIESNADIAKNWAFNKIYHLIGLMKPNKQNTKIIDEINYLCKKFNIQTPYSKQLEK